MGDRRREASEGRPVALDVRWEAQLEAVPSRELRRVCEDVSAVLDRPQWDVMQFCRRLAERLDANGEVTAVALAGHIEELIADLHQGLDRRTGKPFPSVMLNDRSEIIYDHFRRQLVKVVGGIADAAFAGAVEAGLVFTPPPAAPADGSSASTSKAPAGD